MRIATGTTTRFILTAVAMAGFSGLHAAEPLEVPWTDVCSITQGNHIRVDVAQVNQMLHRLFRARQVRRIAFKAQ